MRYPNTIDKNFYLAYIRKENALKSSGQKLDSVNLNWDLNFPESLVEICIKTIAENWRSKNFYDTFSSVKLLKLFAGFPLFNEIIVCENRCFLADILDVECLPLEKLCNHVKDDAFWKRMFNSKWPSLKNNTTKGKPWIEIYIEKYLSESLEKLRFSEYNVEKIKNLIELCSPFVKCLRITHLEASTESNDPTADHIPFDIILEHLNELKSLSISYDCKTISTFFYLGCTTITENDISKFVRGLTHTDLHEFEFHSSKLDPPMLQNISRALDKTTSLTTISMGNCRFGGLMIAFDNEFCDNNLTP